MKLLVNAKQYRAWNYAIVAAIAFGAYFLRGYIGVIVLAAIMAFLFNPIHQRFVNRYGKGRQGFSASLTFLVSTLVIVVPLAIILLITYLQIKNLLGDLSTNPTSELGSFGQSALDAVNKLLASLPGDHQITTEEVNTAVNNAISTLAGNIVDIIAGTIGNVTKIITNGIIYIYIFVNILMHQDALINVIKKLNPLGRDMSDTYLNKMGSMTKAMTKGQFIIAFMQGAESAIVLYLVGFHSLFSFFLIFLTFLSLIPLGAGIITLPLGVALILTGNVWQGIVVILNHLLVVTNIDNIVRPKLVPKDAKLNSALTILSVFAGVAMFGFLGIIIGPVIMIVLVTTILTYLEVEKSSSVKQLIVNKRIAKD